MIQIDTNKVKEMREKVGCGIFEARSAVERNVIRRRIKEAKNTENLKGIMLDMFPEFEIFERMYPNEIVK